jgi:hypothetical protein
MVRPTFSTVLLAAMLLVAVTVAGPAFGEDFRVENRVFEGNQKMPCVESTTIFYDGAVFDYMKSPAETVVFEPAANRFVLLNLPNRTRTELSTTQLAAFVDHLQAVAAKNKDPLVKFLAAPKFEGPSEETAGEITLSSKLITYRVVLAPEASPGVVDQYRNFCDHYARLNPLLVPGSLPPFGRLVVNAATAERQATPSKVLLTLTAAKGAKKQTTIRSEHRLVRPLDSADIDRVTQARDMMGRFKLASFDDYRKLSPR